MTLAERLAQPDLVGLDDAAAAAALNVPSLANGTKLRDVTVVEARAVLLINQTYASMELIRDGKVEAPLPVQSLVRTVLAALDPPPQAKGTLGTDTPEGLAAITALLGGLVQATLITEAQRDALLALAAAPRSWAEANGFPAGVTFDDVFTARGRPRVLRQE